MYDKIKIKTYRLIVVVLLAFDFLSVLRGLTLKTSQENKEWKGSELRHTRQSKDNYW